MSNLDNEEMLTGGNVSEVYRSGDTVRRELKPDSPKIHKLLKHLENKGFSYAPKFLGIDEKRREILSFIEGEAGNYPLKEYMWSDDVLMEIAKMLRLYHDSVSDFSFGDSWQPIDNTPNNLRCYAIMILRCTTLFLTIKNQWVLLILMLLDPVQDFGT